MKIAVNGHEYASTDELPPDVRAQLQGAGALTPQTPATSVTDPPARDDGIILDGVAMSASEGQGTKPRKKRWWQR